MAGLAIRADYEPAELRRLARRAMSRAQALRLLAIAVALEVFGPENEDILSTGDPKQDRALWGTFLKDVRSVSRIDHRREHNLSKGPASKCINRWSVGERDACVVPIRSLLSEPAQSPARG